MSNVTLVTGAPEDATPSQQLMSSKIEFETDARGRSIGVVKPTSLQRYRLLKMLGPTNAQNQPLVGYAMLACCVRSIDGEKYPPPNSEREIEVMVDRLGDDGFDAIGRCLVKKFGIIAPKDDDEPPAV
jgi:hypothetical protein